MAQGQISGTSNRQLSRLSDQVARVVFLACAILLILVIVSVIIFIGSNAFRIFFADGAQGTSFKEFFTVSNWDPTGNNGNPAYGAAGLILGSVVITLLSVIITAPLAFGLALYFTEAAPRWLATLLQPLIEIFTGMPSVVIGFLGLVILVPFLQKVTASLTGGLQLGGYGWGAATLVLIIMILPTVISVSIDALRAVPGSVREASLALGSTRWQTMSKAILPAAGPGLATAIVLGMARAIGETLAVALVLGGDQLPKDIFTPRVFFQPNVNITYKIVQDFGEVSGAARDAYWTLAFILLVISFLFICVSRYLASRSVYR
ncbi:MAG TPA: phosphate ABC transporter permease subunit PstC [Ktedonobacteraceae bacterium]|nr:phosphate ABC transporter permease subunit PstC [Ktedonobacteraceae bacterium]